MRPPTNRPSTHRRVTVVEAATILGITPDAVRSRLRRGTLTKDTGDDGTVYVLLDGHTDQTTDRPTDQTTTDYINALTSQIEYLKTVVEKRDEEIRRRDHLLAAALERIQPPLESAPEPPGRPETPSEDKVGDRVQDDRERSSWWKRLFGVPQH